MHIAHYAFHAERRKGSTIFLAFSCVIGFLVGFFIFRKTEPLPFLLMRSTLNFAVSIVGSLFCILLPFLISAFAVTFGIPWLIYLLCFWEAFLYFYVSLVFIVGYQPFGFTVRCFLLFGNLISFPCLYFYWINYLSKNQHSISWEKIIFLLVGILIGLVDYYLAASFCLIF